MPLMDFIHALESALGVEAQLDLLPMQPGDVHTTFADTSLLETERGYRASTDLSEGIASFVAWYKNIMDEIGWGRRMTSLFRVVGLLLGCPILRKPSPFLD